MPEKGHRLGSGGQGSESQVMPSPWGGGRGGEGSPLSQESPLHGEATDSSLGSFQFLSPAASKHPELTPAYAAAEVRVKKHQWAGRNLGEVGGVGKLDVSTHA